MNGHVRVLCVVTLLFCSIAQSQLSLNFFARGVCPKQDQLFALGFYNGKISLIGGENIGRSLVEFDVDTELFSDYGSFALTNNVGGGQYNQFHVQSGSYVYMIKPDGTYLQRYDLASGILTNNWKWIPTGAKSAGCLTTDGAVLYVVGGGNNNYNLKTVQRLSLSTGNWLAMRNMQTTRREASCAYNADKDALYAIGGYYSGTNLDTVEWNTLSRISSGNAFSILSNRLNVPTLDSFAVSSGTKVYVLGGYVGTASNTNDYTTVDTIHVIETSTNTISVSPNRLAIDVGGFSGILVNDDIYVFTGKGNGGGIANAYGPIRDWQTTKATGQPSKVPTASPTRTPTQTPSSTPTATPTTPSPTEPGGINCGDSVEGAYGGVALTISVNMAFEGAMTFDARASSLAIPASGLRRSTSPSVLDNGLGDEDAIAGVLTISNLDAGTYLYLLDFGADTGTFSIATQCRSDSPTKAPTRNPTPQTPTKIPTRAPNLDPTIAATTAVPSRGALITATMASSIDVDYSITIEVRDASCVEVLTTAIDVVASSLPQAEVDKQECSNDQDVVTVTLLVAIPSNVQLETDVIGSTLKEAMGEEYGDATVDVEMDEKEEQTSEASSAAEWLWLLYAGLCIVSVCIGFALFGVFKYFQAKREHHRDSEEIQLHHVSELETEEKKEDVIQPGVGEADDHDDSEGRRASIVREPAQVTSGVVDEHEATAGNYSANLTPGDGLEQDEFEVSDDIKAAVNTTRGE